MKGKKTGNGPKNKTKEVKAKTKKKVKKSTPIPESFPQRRGGRGKKVGANNCLLEDKVFFSWKVSIPFQIIWIIFLLLFTIYTLLISFAPKIETEITFPGKNINYLDVLGECPNIGLNFEEINILDGNGNNINGLYLKGENDKTIYYFHGNGVPINCFFNEILYIHELGYNVMAYDYPGYGKSTGFPYKEVTDNFSREFFKYIQKEKGLKNEDLIIWGFSIGSALAVDFASKNDFDKIVLLAPLSSRYDYAQDKIGFIPQIFLFLKDSFVTRDLVRKLPNNALILHGNADKLIPFEEGIFVYASYFGKKYFIELDGIGHNNIIQSSGEALKDIFKQFLETGGLDFKNNYLFLDEKTRKFLELENKIDFYTDSSLQKFVTSNIPYNDMLYVPENLVYINSEYIYDMKGGVQTLRKDASDALNELGKAFYEEFDKKLGIVSAYRSYYYQAQIKQGCADIWCAKPGYSEHQSGLAVDVFEASNEGNWRNTSSLHKYFDWLVENAHKYGFHNTYQKGVAVDGYEVEPWHWRYMGVDLATYLHENDMTLAEYYKTRNKFAFYEKKSTLQSTLK